MALTPDDIRNVAFNKPPIGRRGYDEEEVDVFLDEIERTLIELYDRLRQAGSAPPLPTPRSESAADLAEIKAALARIEARLAASGSTTPGGSLF
jgi:DivIVA domain-containing protein